MWNNISIVDSSEGNVSKLIFKSDTAVAESVLYRYPDYKTRTVICCSTMSGCPIGCRFCGAGDYFVRTLSGEEIVNQVETALKEVEIREGTIANEIGKLQIMFMSMGEPMLNKRGMTDALRTLSVKYPNAALLISTIGPRIDYEWFIKLSMEIETIGLQFSIHESTNEKRNTLIPFANKLTLQEIRQLGINWFLATGRKPFINYCAHDGNSSTCDAVNLYALFPPQIFNATISVICEPNEGMPSRNDHQVGLAADFSSLMIGQGYDVRVFDPAGQDDIGGGCGQLWFVQDWMEQNPDKAKPSCGNGRKRVGAPRKIA